jgi:hypothetical protein
LTTPSYIPILVPALGLLVPFLIRWIENKSRLKQARHLLDVIQTRDEIAKLLKDAESEGFTLLDNEESQLRYYEKELEKEIRRNDIIEIRLYPVLISLEIIFFVSALFSGAISFLEKLIYAQGNQTLPFLEGIFSNSNIRISLLLICLLTSLYLTHSVQKKLILRFGYSKATELKIFGIFNLFFLSCILTLGLVLFILDWIMPWF